MVVAVVSPQIYSGENVTFCGSYEKTLRLAFEFLEFSFKFENHDRISDKTI